MDSAITKMETQSSASAHSTCLIRARHVFAYLMFGLGFAVAGCGPKISVTWDSPKPEIHNDTKLCVSGVEVGHVTDAHSENGHFIARARLDRKHAADVKLDSSFLIRQPEGAPAYIDVISPSSDSPPVHDGAILRGSDTEVGAHLGAFGGNWKLGTAGVVVGIVMLAVFAGAFIRLAATMLCLGAGVAGAYFLPPYVLPYLARWVPAEFRPDLLAYVAGFLIAYMASLLLVHLLRAPASAIRD